MFLHTSDTAVQYSGYHRWKPGRWHSMVYMGRGLKEFVCVCMLEVDLVSPQTVVFTHTNIICISTVGIFMCICMHVQYA